MNGDCSKRQGYQLRCLQLKKKLKSIDSSKRGSHASTQQMTDKSKDSEPGSPGSAATYAAVMHRYKQSMLDRYQQHAALMARQKAVEASSSFQVRTQTSTAVAVHASLNRESQKKRVSFDLKPVRKSTAPAPASHQPPADKPQPIVHLSPSISSFLLTPSTSIKNRIQEDIVNMRSYSNRSLDVLRCKSYYSTPTIRVSAGNPRGKVFNIQHSVIASSSNIH